MQGVALSYPKNAAKFLFPIFELMGTGVVLLRHHPQPFHRTGQQCSTCRVLPSRTKADAAGTLPRRTRKNAPDFTD